MDLCIAICILVGLDENFSVDVSSSFINKPFFMKQSCTKHLHKERLINFLQLSSKDLLYILIVFSVFTEVLMVIKNRVRHP